MTPDQFKQWRKSLRWSKARAAKELGISVSSISLYEHGTRFDNGAPVEIPKTVELACLFHSRKCLTAAAREFLSAWDECGRWPDTSTDIGKIDAVASKIETLIGGAS